MSSKKNDESGYDLDLDLLTISYYSHVSYPKRSGLLGKNNHLRHMYRTPWRLLESSSPSRVGHSRKTIGCVGLNFGTLNILARRLPSFVLFGTYQCLSTIGVHVSLPSPFLFNACYAFLTCTDPSITCYGTIFLARQHGVGPHVS